MSSAVDKQKPYTSGLAARRRKKAGKRLVRFTNAAKKINK